MTKDMTAPNKVIMIPADRRRNTTPTAYPRGETGVRSPYPTVVSFTRDYKTASPKVRIIALPLEYSEK